MGTFGTDAPDDWGQKGQMGTFGTDAPDDCWGQKGQKGHNSSAVLREATS
jgi:hypothetical protein